MKKLILLFAMIAVCVSCKGDDDAGGSNGFSSSIVADGTPFNPNNGTYTIHPMEEGDFHRGVSFQMQRISGGQVGQALSLHLLVPFSWDDLNGTYRFTFGTADDALANGGYFPDQNSSLYINGGEVQVTDLGNSRFRLAFVGTVGLDVNFGEHPFGGTVEGYFEPTGE